ncbi:MAG: nitrous oxide reductase family maturation protein NosD [Saprospiraceae bacterium]|nr:nitrous oxide reductase family maturation protein NosD [Saprospiraceae bacterium]MBP7699810.1 nitrous oxide reductase family maturation protein NosD [Saprospiraceae bacterium]
MKILYLLILLLPIAEVAVATTLVVGKHKRFESVQEAIRVAHDGDTVLVYAGIYKEGNIIINKTLRLIGIDNPVLDGEQKYEILSVKADNVVVKGFTIKNSGYSTLNDPGGIKIYDSNGVLIENNILENNFFGIYIQYGKNCIVRNNKLTAYATEEQKIGNGIHCWKSDSLLIIGNKIKGHRDGIYFEFVSNSLIWRNISNFNIRYGLHFMFSNTDAYIANIFEANGAGVAVMYSKSVLMYNNVFKNNWGEAAYGILLKEISDGEIIGNSFLANTAALYLEGANRMKVEKNQFKRNGWGLKIQASCMDNSIAYNNFIGNTFDISTNGMLVLNTFNENYWDKYQGYDLNKDNYGDVPYHPLSLFAVITEKNPVTMILFRSFMVELLDKSEKMLPSLTPVEFVDNKPAMTHHHL